MANKKEKGSWVIPIIIIFILLLSMLPAALATYLYYRSYKQLPDAPGKRLSLFYAVISCIPLYIAGAVLFPIINSKVFGGQYEVGNSWLICFLLVFLVALPSWIAYLRQIKKINTVSGDAESYAEELYEALKNKKLDDKEIEHLKILLEESKIPADVLSKIHKDAFVSTLLNCATDDFIISPVEKKLLKRIAENMNINQEVLDYADEIIEQAKSTRRIIDGKDKGLMTSEFIPQKNERCIMLEDCTLYESVKKGVYVGTSVGLKEVLPLGHMFSPRFYLGKRIDYDQLEEVDSGKIALTTKRVAFGGGKTTRSFNLNDIIGLDIGPDGFQISRQGKAKKEVFQMTDESAQMFIGALYQVIR